jgi:hypothetical protein
VYRVFFDQKGGSNHDEVWYFWHQSSIEARWAVVFLMQTVSRYSTEVLRYSIELSRCLILKSWSLISMLQCMLKKSWPMIMMLRYSIDRFWGIKKRLSFWNNLI